MADMTEGLPGKVARIEQKLDEGLGKGLRKEMVDGFTRVEGLLATNTSGLARLERKLDQFMADHDRPPNHRRGRRLPKKR